MEDVGLTFDEEGDDLEVNYLRKRSHQVEAIKRWFRISWIVISHVGGGGEQNTLYKGVETFPRVLKLWGEVWKGKPKEDNIC